MRFEWDPVKAAKNVAKHGVPFEDAVLVFQDPFQRSRQDRHEDGEERWQTLGVVGNLLILLLVAHTWLDEDGTEVIEIISARRATKQERREYEQGQ